METQLIKKEDLSLIDKNVLTAKQLNQIFKKTPQKFIMERPGKGGGKWKYVTGGYITKVLNLMFGFNWDFQQVDKWREGDEVIVHGRLTCRNGQGDVIVKEQFGNKEIICKRGTDKPISIGNDYKAAATDALKKCATSIGIAQDVYNPDEYREVRVDTTDAYEIDDQKESRRILEYILSSGSKEQLEGIEDIVLSAKNDTIKTAYELRLLQFQKALK